MSVAPYIGVPSKDVQLSVWSQTFSDAIFASPATYGLSLTDANNIKTANDNWQTSYNAIIDPMTRTPAAVATKVTERAVMLATLRPYYVIIQNDPGVSDSDKLAAGVKVKSLAKTPRNVPNTNPILSLIAATPLQLTMLVQDPNNTTLRGIRPPNVAGVEIWVELSATPTHAVENAKLWNVYSKQPSILDFVSGDVGKTAVIWARWIGVRRTDKHGPVQTGPWSTAVTTTVI